MSASGELVVVEDMSTIVHLESLQLTALYLGPPHVNFIYQLMLTLVTSESVMAPLQAFSRVGGRRDSGVQTRVYQAAELVS